MPSPKEVLLKHGRIEKITRGRISRDNHEFLANLAANGEKIDGYEVKVSTKPTGEKVFSNAKPPVSGEKTIADIGIATRDENTIEAFIYRDGKKKNVFIREVCSDCMASLTYCHCTTPHFRLDNDEVAPVYFRERTTPFVKGW